jgi:hypothetical protein
MTRLLFDLKEVFIEEFVELVSEFLFFALEDRHCFCFAFVSRPDYLVLVKV